MAMTAPDWSALFSNWLVGNPGKNGEQRGFCPIHEEPGVSKTPSASFNMQKQSFFCHVCEIGFGFAALRNVMQENGDLDADVVNIKEERKARGKAAPMDELPSEQDIQEWTDLLLRNEPAMKFLKQDRGISKETVVRFRMGLNRGRITIPVYDEEGELQNVRQYKPKSRGSAKMTNIDGHGDARLFPISVLAGNEEVIIAEGEMDAILANQLGFPALSGTAGAGTWRPAWNDYFMNKTVFLVYDVDEQGFAGANKVAGSLERYAKAIYIVRLPIDIKSADITDYFVNQGYSAEDFRDLLEASRATPFGALRGGANKRGEQPMDVGVEQSMDSTLAGKCLTMDVTIAGKVQPPYLMPKRVEYRCHKDWTQTKCAGCPMTSRWNGFHEENFSDDDAFLLKLIDRNDEARKRKLLEAADIPPSCPKVKVDEPDLWNVEELIVVPSMEQRADHHNRNPVDRKVYNVGTYNTPINTQARVTGYNSIDPKGGRALFQSWRCEQTKTDLDRFEITPEMADELFVFQPREGQAPLEKLQIIARDLEANVTRIYDRPELHMAYDVTWHSVVDFNFLGKPVGKGWIELLVVGDTRTGKSEAALRLCDHYRAGVLKSCEGATLAGLVGGAQQRGDVWMVQWGTIPLNDRRLVVLDEFSGIADKNVIEQMSSVRSSGRAQITKIVSQETSARTRLIWISNPADGRTIAEHPTGAIEAVKLLVKNPEDIARFDLAMAVSTSEVDSSRINSTDPPKVKHRFTAERCSAVVAWAWSRKPEQIVWEDGVERFVLQQAEELGARYINDPPLIQAENVRIKIARLAVAIAARLFSCDETFQCIVIGKEHVQAAVQLLDTLYGMASFGYAQHSRKTIRDRGKAEGNRRAAVQYLTLHKDDVYRALQQCTGGPFRNRDFVDFAAMSPDQAQAAVVALSDMKLIRRLSKGYLRMEPALIDVLKYLEDKWDD